ncbi:MAG: biotin-dependent carboxyltransferase family protein [Paracoccus sp. (in: a-proteobacteria)]|uniref:5-oxoprolinase subunit C family protein n=1 Tax=Paracoccus sp. TaxID=267 RepID=UPI00391974B5
MIEVLFIPPGATVQDLGRDGFWAQGLGRAGAMDTLSHRIANMLLDNPADAATIEIPLTPARLRFTTTGSFGLVGAACGATLAGRPLPRVWAGAADAGDLLELGAMTQGARCYLALPGGIDVPLVLGSRSTQLREGFGGLEGRVLAAGDILRGASLPADLRRGGLSLTMPPLYQDGANRIVLRALASTEHDDFSAAAQDAFWSTGYTVTAQSNRQGYRLEGQALDYNASAELRSHGIGPGIVQVPGGGQPIIQLADSATMGGYPKIAAVIEPDLWRIAQARPGDVLCFHRVDLTEAAAAARELQTTLDELHTQIRDFSIRQKGWA